MAISDYTTYDTIRALLGVNGRELKDTNLALPIYETQFLLELSDVDSGGGEVMVQYAAIKTIIDASGTPTADQKRFYDLVNLLAAYSVARQLLGSDDNAIPLRITDGKAEVERRPDNTRMRDAVEGGWTRFMKRLRALLLVLVPTANVTLPASRTFIASVGIATDPVTGT
jgi:hypothetical protein